MFQKQIIIFLFLISIQVNGQIIEKVHSAKKASFMSTVIPGSGQFYNKKYWKIPIIYLSIGSAFYIARWNQNKYLHYRKAYEYRTDNFIDTIDPYENQYSESNLVTIKDYYRKNRDLGYIITAGLYILNIIDASVDAHLFNFNVNDNLSFKIQTENQKHGSISLANFSLKLKLN